MFPRKLRVDDPDLPILWKHVDRFEMQMHDDADHREFVERMDGVRLNRAARSVTDSQTFIAKHDPDAFVIWGVIETER